MRWLGHRLVPRQQNQVRRSDSRFRAASQLAVISSLIYPGRRALRLALALGYYRSPLQGFQFPASPTVGSLSRWFETINGGISSIPNNSPSPHTSKPDCGRHRRCLRGRRAARICSRGGSWPGRRPAGASRDGSSCHWRFGLRYAVRF